MANKTKRKRRMAKSLSKREKELLKIELDKAWRRIFVKAGVLNGES